jgi:hypothetical protein
MIPNRAIFPHNKQNPALALNEYTHANNSSRKLSVTNDRFVENATPEMSNTALTHINPNPNAKSPLTALRYSIETLEPSRLATDFFTSKGRLVKIETLKTNAHNPNTADALCNAASGLTVKNHRSPPPTTTSHEEEEGNALFLRLKNPPQKLSLLSFFLFKVVVVPPKPSKKEEAKSPIADVTHRALPLKTPSLLREASPKSVFREEEEEGEEEENASVSFGNADDWS